VEQGDTSQFADRLPAFLDAVRGRGIVDASADLLQVFASLILLRESQTGQSDTADYSQLATVEDRADARVALLRLWWRVSSQVLRVPAPPQIPQLITVGGNAAARVVDFVWDETELHPLNKAQGRRELLQDLETIIRLWLRESKYATSFATPPALTELMLSLGQLKPGDDVYDPCCGIGGLLAGAGFRLSPTAGAVTSTGHSASRVARIVGMELDSSLHTIALARILLSGDIQSQLKIGNTLAEPTRVEDDAERFDCVLANLPFGVRQPKELHWNYPIHTSSSESLFVQHVLSRLRRGGRAVIVVPESFLLRRGADVELRRRLLESYSVESVWSLPPGTFSASSSLKTSILVIRHDIPRKEVVFVNDRLIRLLFDKESVVSTTFGSGNTHALVALASGLRAHGSMATLASSGEPSPLIDDIPSLPLLPAIIPSTARPWHAEKGLADLVTRIPVQELAERHWELLPKRTGVEELQSSWPLCNSTLVRSISQS
jgi:hypothetical protein